MTQGSATIRRPLLVALALVAFSTTARADSVSDRLKLARSAYEYGDFAGALRDLTPTSDIDALPKEDDRVEAWRIVGLSHFFLGKPTRGEAQQYARAAFFELLKQNPDYQLDPLFVPPDAIAFFDSIRRDEDVALARIRPYRRARIEQEALEQEARRLASLHDSPPAAPAIVDRRVIVSSPVIALMPLGLGQFQNGNISAGAGLAAGQAAGILTSILSFLMIEVLRDQSSHQFKGDNLRLARDFDIAKWVGAGVFYGLWIGGGIEAAIHFVPERVAEPSAAPAGALKPPTPILAPPLVPPTPHLPPPPSSPTPPIEPPLKHPVIPTAPTPPAPRPDKITNAPTSP